MLIACKVILKDVWLWLRDQFDLFTFSINNVDVCVECWDLDMIWAGDTWQQLARSGVKHDQCLESESAQCIDSDPGHQCLEQTDVIDVKRCRAVSYRMQSQEDHQRSWVSERRQEMVAGGVGTTEAAVREQSEWAMIATIDNTNTVTCHTIISTLRL